MIIVLLSSGGALSAQDRTTVKTVVIDAGHGGKDPGTVSKKFREKDITLAVALRLGELIGRNCPDVKVVYTRKTDVFIALNERSDIANRARADLFMSIHVNGAEDRSATGTETFIMGVDKSGGNMNVAMKENDVITYEDDYSTKYEGFQAGSTESYIIFSLMQYSHQEQSRQVASLIQDQYSASVDLANRGVKQGPFLVLWRTAMPSVLTELGFISNSRDEALLSTDAGRERYAQCLFNAFRAYKTKIDGRGRLMVRSDDPVPPASDRAPQGTVTVRRDYSEPVGGVVFCVQLCTSSARLGVGHDTFKGLKGNVYEKNVNGIWKYYVGECGSYDEAGDLQKQVKRVVPDAFVAAFRNGTPVTVSEARRISGR